MFDASIKATVIDGKTFNPGDGFDKDKHYSKKVFAHKVVRPKADTIDFTGFRRPLLTNLTAATQQAQNVRSLSLMRITIYRK